MFADRNTGGARPGLTPADPAVDVDWNDVRVSVLDGRQTLGHVLAAGRDGLHHIPNSLRRFLQSCGGPTDAKAPIVPRPRPSPSKLVWPWRSRKITVASIKALIARRLAAGGR